MPIQQTIVRYGSLTISQCHTRKFDQTPVYDVSGTDLLYYRTVVRVVGYVTGGDVTTVGISPNTGNGNAADSHRLARVRVLPPREDFEMILGADENENGGTTLIEVKAATVADQYNASGLDLNNGPKCVEFSITNIAANNILRVEVEFELCILECDDSGDVPNNKSGVLSNRWSVSDVIDGDFYTTRTYTGQLRLMHVVSNPSEFRGLIVPTLQPGLRRESMMFNVSVDGLTVEYTIIDKEVAFSAPAPATSWHYDYTESTGDAMLKFGDIRIRLSGDRNVNKSKLIQIAGAMIDAKLMNGLRERFIVEYVSITDSYGTAPNVNTVTASARIRHIRTPQQFRWVANDRLGKPIRKEDLSGVVDNYDSTLSRGGRDGEILELEGPIQSAGAFSVYLQSPCEYNHALGDGPKSGPPESDVEGEKVPVRAFLFEELPPDGETAWLSSSHYQAIYTKYQVESIYDSTTNKVQLPIAQSATSSTIVTSAVVALSQNTGKRIVRVEAERVGKWPELPVPEDYIDSPSGGPLGAVLLSLKFRPGSRERTPDGKELFRSGVEYVFSLSRPYSTTENMPVGFNPWESEPIRRTDSDMFISTDALG